MIYMVIITMSFINTDMRKCSSSCFYVVKAIASARVILWCWNVCFYQDICEVPTKCIRSMETFDVFAKILFIDFEGRSDGESIRKIISQIRPRQLVSIW